MGSDNQGEQRTFLIGLVVLIVTLYGVAAHEGWLDDIGRAAGHLFGWLFR